MFVHDAIFLPPRPKTAASRRTTYTEFLTDPSNSAACWKAFANIWKNNGEVYVGFVRWQAQNADQMQQKRRGESPTNRKRFGGTSRGQGEVLPTSDDKCNAACQTVGGFVVVGPTKLLAGAAFAAKDPVGTAQGLWTIATHPNGPDYGFAEAMYRNDRENREMAGNHVANGMLIFDVATVATGVGVAGKFLRAGTTKPAAANTATSLAVTDLNAAQLSNFGRYTSKLPAAAEGTVITAGESGVVPFTTRVPGRVPGSYATYAKTVDEAGTTIGYNKTTIAPDGTVVSVKDKLAG